MANIWCPGIDNEMQQWMDSAIYFDLAQGQVLTVGDNLSQLSPFDKFYIICHGHSEMPLFSTTLGKWTADQLANLLRANGLPYVQREIELLVCHAGESVNTRQNAQKLMNIRHQAINARANDNAARLEKLQGKYTRTVAKGERPQFFENDPEKLLIPLAAQLTQSLKNLQYTNFRITSYKCPVAPIFTDGDVHLNLEPKGGHYGVKADLNTNYRVIWQ